MEFRDAARRVEFFPALFCFLDDTAANNSVATAGSRGSCGTDLTEEQLRRLTNR